MKLLILSAVLAVLGNPAAAYEELSKLAMARAALLEHSREECHGWGEYAVRHAKPEMREFALLSEPLCMMTALQASNALITEIESGIVTIEAMQQCADRLDPRLADGPSVVMIMACLHPKR